LNCELSRRRQHEQLRLRELELEPAQQRQREGGRLPGPRLCLAEQILALEQRRNRCELDWGRRLVADLADCFEHGIGQPKVGEAQGGALRGGFGHRGRDDPRSEAGWQLDASARTPGTGYD
jgi:hypothetical protein